GIQIHLPAGSSFRGTIVRNSIFDHCGKFFGTETPTNRPNAIILWNSGAKEALIYNNIIKNCGAGIQVGGGTSGHKIYHNLVFNCANFNLLCDSSTSNLSIHINFFLKSGGTNFFNASFNSSESHNIMTGTPGDHCIDLSLEFGRGDFRIISHCSVVKSGSWLDGEFSYDCKVVKRGNTLDIRPYQYSQVVLRRRRCWQPQYSTLNLNFARRER